MVKKKVRHTCYKAFFFSTSGLDLLSKKSLHAVEGVSRLQPRGWQLHNNFTGFRIPRSKSEDLFNKLYGDFSLRLSCHLLHSSRGSVLTVRHPHHQLPLLDLQLDLVQNTLVFRYLGVRSFQRVEASGVFPSSPWSRLQVDLLGQVLTVHVDCHKGVRVKLRQALAGIPPDAHLYFGDSRRRQPGLEVRDLA